MDLGLAEEVAGSSSTENLDGLDRVIAVPVDWRARTVRSYWFGERSTSTAGSTCWCTAWERCASASLAQEFGPKGIRVNCVSPGQVSTERWLGEHGVAETVAEATGVSADTVRETAVAGIATGQFNTAEEVATVITMLASGRNANVTGVNYIIDGSLIETT